LNEVEQANDFTKRLKKNELTRDALDEIIETPARLMNFFSPPLTVDELAAAYEWIAAVMKNTRVEGEKMRGRLGELPAIDYAFFIAAISEPEAESEPFKSDLDEVNEVLKAKGYFEGFTR